MKLLISFFFFNFLQIFTNSDRNHAITCLKRLGIADCFDQIICFETMNPNLSKATRPDEFPVLLKPSMDAMKLALHVANVDPRHAVRQSSFLIFYFEFFFNFLMINYSAKTRFIWQLFLDDNIKNVTAGKALGLRTVLVILLAFFFFGNKFSTFFSKENHLTFIYIYEGWEDGERR